MREKWCGFMVRFAKVGEPWAFKFFEDEELAKLFADNQRAKKGWVAEHWEL